MYNFTQVGKNGHISVVRNAQYLTNSGVNTFLPPVGGHEYIIYIFSCFLLPSVCRYQEVERPGNWDSGPGVVDVSVISTTALALSPDRVDCQCPCKVSRVHNRGKVLLP